MTQADSLNRRRLLVAGSVGLAACLMGSEAKAQSERRPKMIVDTQVNLWTGGKPPAYRRQAPFLATDLLGEMSKAGVTQAIIVPVSWNPDGDKTPLVASVNYPDKFRVFDILKFGMPPDPDKFVAWNKRPGMLGTRLFLMSPKAQAWLTDGSADWLWPVAEQNEIPLMFQAAPPTVIDTIARKFPDLKICIDSLGALPDKRGMDAFADQDDVLALAKHKNVNIKIASVPYLSASLYPFSNMEPVLRRTYHAFGPKRMFWGSDIGLLEPLGVTYSQSVTAFVEQSWLSQADLDWIMGKSFSHWAGWPHSA